MNFIIIKYIRSLSVFDKNRLFNEKINFIKNF